MADTDTSQSELKSPPHTNGVLPTDGIDEEDRAKMRPADIDADVKEMERRKRVDMIMSSKLFREELERIIETQLKDGAGSASGLMQQISDMMGVGKTAGNTFKASNCVVPINDIRGVEAMGFAKGEKILRCKLAAVYRLVDLYGWSQGTSTLITARLNQDEEHFLVNPYGMLFHEITASSLIKVDMQGQVVEQGTTNFSVNIASFSLHAAIHSSRPDIKCIIHVRTPSVVAISALKCGILPISEQAVVIGETSTHLHLGGVLSTEEIEKIARNLGPNNKVLILTNQGIVCCGETIEEAFFNARNTVLACEQQLKLMPVGIDNLVLITDEQRKKLYDAAHKAPESTPRPDQPSVLEGKVERKWRVGGVEFEALMRMLDNAGFRTGYIYRHPLVKGDLPKPKNDVEVPPAVSSLGYLLEEEELYRQGLWKKLEGGKKGNDRTRWLNSPNVYQKVEILETGTPDPKKITKWVTDGSPTHSSTPVKIENALQFVPKNTNPKEFKLLQQQIKDYRRADKISAGPQSHILEGVTWEEAKKMQDASVTQTGDQVVLMGAASKGIIQRGYQHNATMYKSPYAKNPFDCVTDEELDEYKRVVERKARGEFDDTTDYSESEGLSSAQINKRISDVRSPTSVASETEEESRDEPQVLRIETTQAPKPSQPEVVMSDDEPLSDQQQYEAIEKLKSEALLQQSPVSRASIHSTKRSGKALHSYRTTEHFGLPKGSYLNPNPTHYHIARTRYINEVCRPKLVNVSLKNSNKFNNGGNSGYKPKININVGGRKTISLDISFKTLKDFIAPFASVLNLGKINNFEDASSQTSFWNPQSGVNIVEINSNRSERMEESTSFSDFETDIMKKMQEDILSSNTIDDVNDSVCFDEVNNEFNSWMDEVREEKAKEEILADYYDQNLDAFAEEGKSLGENKSQDISLTEDEATNSIGEEIIDNFHVQTVSLTEELNGFEELNLSVSNKSTEKNQQEENETLYEVAIAEDIQEQTLIIFDKQFKDLNEELGNAEPVIIENSNKHMEKLIREEDETSTGDGITENFDEQPVDIFNEQITNLNEELKIVKDLNNRNEDVVKEELDETSNEDKKTDTVDEEILDNFNVQTVSLTGELKSFEELNLSVSNKSTEKNGQEETDTSDEVAIAEDIEEQPLNIFDKQFKDLNEELENVEPVIIENSSKHIEKLIREEDDTSTGDEITENFAEQPVDIFNEQTKNLNEELKIVEDLNNRNEEIVKEELDETSNEDKKTDSIDEEIIDNFNVQTVSLPEELKSFEKLNLNVSNKSTEKNQQEENDTSDEIAIAEDIQEQTLNIFDKQFKDMNEELENTKPVIIEDSNKLIENVLREDETSTGDDIAENFDEQTFDIFGDQIKNLNEELKIVEDLNNRNEEIVKQELDETSNEDKKTESIHEEIIDNFNVQTVSLTEELKRFEELNLSISTKSTEKNQQENDTSDEVAIVEDIQKQPLNIFDKQFIDLNEELENAEPVIIEDSIKLIENVLREEDETSTGDDVVENFDEQTFDIYGDQIKNLNEELKIVEDLNNRNEKIAKEELYETSNEDKKTDSIVEEIIDNFNVQTVSLTEELKSFEELNISNKSTEKNEQEENDTSDEVAIVEDIQKQPLNIFDKQFTDLNEELENAEPVIIEDSNKLIENVLREDETSTGDDVEENFDEQTFDIFDDQIKSLNEELKIVKDLNKRNEEILKEELDETSNEKEITNNFDKATLGLLILNQESNIFGDHYQNSDEKEITNNFDKETLSFLKLNNASEIFEEHNQNNFDELHEELNEYVEIYQPCNLPEDESEAFLPQELFDTYLREYVNYFQNESKGFAVYVKATENKIAEVEQHYDEIIKRSNVRKNQLDSFLMLLRKIVEHAKTIVNDLPEDELVSSSDSVKPMTKEKLIEEVTDLCQYFSDHKCSYENKQAESNNFHTSNKLELQSSSNKTETNDDGINVKYDAYKKLEIKLGVVKNPRNKQFKNHNRGRRSPPSIVLYSVNNKIINKKIRIKNHSNGGTLTMKMFKKERSVGMNTIAKSFIDVGCSTFSPPKLEDIRQNIPANSICKKELFTKTKTSYEENKVRKVEEFQKEIHGKVHEEKNYKEKIQNNCLSVENGAIKKPKRKYLPTLKEEEKNSGRNKKHDKSSDIKKKYQNDKEKKVTENKHSNDSRQELNSQSYCEKLYNLFSAIVDITPIPKSSDLNQLEESLTELTNLLSNPPKVDFLQFGKTCFPLKYLTVMKKMVTETTKQLPIIQKIIRTCKHKTRKGQVCVKGLCKNMPKIDDYICFVSIKCILGKPIIGNRELERIDKFIKHNIKHIMFEDVDQKITKSTKVPPIQNENECLKRALKMTTRQLPIFCKECAADIICAFPLHFFDFNKDMVVCLRCKGEITSPYVSIADLIATQNLDEETLRNHKCTKVDTINRKPLKVDKSKELKIDKIIDFEIDKTKDLKIDKVIDLIVDKTRDLIIDKTTDLITDKTEDLKNNNSKDKKLSTHDKETLKLNKKDLESEREANAVSAFQSGKSQSGNEKYWITMDKKEIKEEIKKTNDIVDNIPSNPPRDLNLSTSQLRKNRSLSPIQEESALSVNTESNDFSDHLASGDGEYIQCERPHEKVVVLNEAHFFRSNFSDNPAFVQSSSVTFTVNKEEEKEEVGNWMGFEKAKF